MALQTNFVMPMGISQISDWKMKGTGMPVWCRRGCRRWVGAGIARRVTNSPTLEKVQRPPYDIFVENVHVSDLTNKYGLESISSQI